MEKYLISVCGSELWNPRAVYDENPDFTFCFQYTLLVWIPCLFLWCAAPFWVFTLNKRGPNKIKISYLYIFKLFLCTCLLFIELINIYNAWKESATSVYFLTPIIKLATFSLVASINHLERKGGRRNSSLSFVFWLLMTLTSCITLRSKLLFHFSYVTFTDLNKLKLADHDLSLFYVHFGLILTNLVITAFSEKVLYRVVISKNTPELNTSLLSKLTFWWINPLINIGFKRDFTREDLFEIDDRELSEASTRKLEKIWNPLAREYIKQIRKLEDNKNLNFTDNQEHDETTQKLNPNTNFDELEVKIKNFNEPSLGLCMLRIYFLKFVGIIAIKCGHDLLNFAKPILLDKLITFVKDKDQKVIVGIFYIFLLSLSSLSQTLIMQHYYHSIFLLGNRMKIGLMTVIYKKSLRLSPSARKSTTVGEMTNLITTNTYTFESCVYHLIGIVSTPLQIFISTWMLYKFLGYATFFGLASMLIFLPLNAFFAKKSKKIRREKYKIQDSRIKMMNEILSGIRVIKFYGWEVSFEKIVKKLRTNELANLIKAALLSTLSGFTWSCAPFVVAAVSFLVYILIDPNNNLDPNTAFVSLTLFNMLRFPLNFLPYIIQGLVQLNVSMTRIRKFLLKDEIKSEDISHNDLDDIAVQVDNASFSWDKNEPLLKNLNLNVYKGELVAIIGKVGSGKSSLLSGLLNEMHLVNGKLNLNGSTAYVSQQAWIQNASIKKNILFNLSCNEEFYEKILEACCLLPDLEILPSGDNTEIGEKGINLSGGQKQRISLARAIYSNADIFMLDDPLSAVDSHVGKQIFNKVIGPAGLLKDKTRLFVTNSLNYLNQCDRIIMFENGSIVEMGTFNDLQTKNGKFIEFLKSFNDIKEASQDFIKSFGPSAEKKESLETKEVTRDDKLKKEDKVVSKIGEKLIEKEKIQSGNVKISVVLEYLKACRLWLSAIFIIMYILSVGCDMASSFWLSDWSNKADQEKSNALNATISRDETTKFFRLGIYASLGFSKSFISLLANMLFVGMYIKASKSLHEKLLQSVLKGNLRFFETTPIGRIVNRFTKDIEATEDSIPYSIKSLIECSLSLLSTVTIISTSTPLFLVALLPISIFYIFVQRYFVPSNRQLKRMQAATKSPIFSHFSECQAGVSTIRAYNAQNRCIKIMQENIDEHLVHYYCNTVSNRWLALRLEIIGNVITILAAFFAITSRSSLSAGVAGLSISISLSISSNLNWFVRTVSEFEANITSVERIIEYFQIKHEPEWTTENKPEKNWPQNGNIIFNNYSVKYREELDWVLKKLNFSIFPGEKIGIVGRTGAGKSSLTLGLFRMVDFYSGDIVIDEVDIEKIGLHDLRHKLTIIPQESVIFSGTIRMNLDPFEIYSDEELWKALELAHLKDYIQGLDKQLDHECSEDGSNLSVGQKQLVCLARALLRKTKILILDEATASVDHNTDELIQQTIRTQFSDCTVLTIAHRLNTIMDYSRILVLDNGRVVEFDSPKNLISNPNSLFHSMAYHAGLINKNFEIKK
uniref:ABC-type glutathione-S-conjugate transporter n=1 Tax=Brachionus plicatilis TaxID=10195 RepID=A0A7H9SQD1_BRAPC|nr:ATP-binding cassette transporter subfamily C member 1 X7 [Brachionus plicatilis]